MKPDDAVTAIRERTPNAVWRTCLVSGVIDIFFCFFFFSFIRKKKIFSVKSNIFFPFLFFFLLSRSTNKNGRARSIRLGRRKPNGTYSKISKVGNKAFDCNAHFCSYRSRSGVGQWACFVQRTIV